MIITTIEAASTFHLHTIFQNHLRNRAGDRYPQMLGYERTQSSIKPGNPAPRKARGFHVYGLFLTPPVNFFRPFPFVMAPIDPSAHASAIG